MTTIASKLSYQRLRHEVLFEDDEDRRRRRSITLGRISPRKWVLNRLKRVHIRRKFRVKIAGFTKLFKIRRSKVVARITLAKIFKRLKESQSHFGDLFAGNYLFMQVTPAKTSFVGHHIQKKNSNNNLSGFRSRFNNYAIQKAA